MKKINNLGILVISFVGLLVLLLLFFAFKKSIILALGTFFIFFIPGFILVNIFLKKESTLDKIILSIILSVVITPLVLLYLFKLGFQVSPLRLYLLALVVIVILLIVSFFKRKK